MTTYGGYDTTDTIQSDYSSAVSHFGTPKFWMRYFSPCPDLAVNSSSSNANAELRAAWDSGGGNLGPICDPSGTRESSNSSAEGHADAQTFCNALLQTWIWVGPLELPANNALYCYLDVEASTALSVNYWFGWAQYLILYNWNSTGTYPLYPCMYCNPCAAPPNCSSVANSGIDASSIWASEPLRCSNKVSNPPSWAPQTCSGCGVSGVAATKIWQFADAGSGLCYTSPNVDQDLTNYAIWTNTFNLASRP